MKFFKRLIKDKNKIVRSIRRAFDAHPIVKFISVLFVLIIYFLFVVRSNGVEDGILISILTWSFFVLCTPVADAGVLIDLPFRLITGIKMIYSEVFVWLVAIVFNLFIFFKIPLLYEKTILLSLFKHVLNHPFPYWSIIVLSGIGTFLSVYIADNIVDFKKQKERHANLLTKHKVLIFVTLIILIIVLYDFLLNKLGVNIPLI